MKDKLTHVTDADTIAAIERNAFGDPVPVEKTETGYWVLTETLRQYRQDLSNEIESLSGGNPGEKSEGLHSDHRGIPQARSSEGGNVGKSPGVSIQSREPVDSNSVSVGRLSPEPRYATDVDAAPSLHVQPFTDRGEQ